jgi:hypothetical protein
MRTPTSAWREGRARHKPALDAAHVVQRFKQEQAPGLVAAAHGEPAPDGGALELHFKRQLRPFVGQVGAVVAVHCGVGFQRLHQAQAAELVQAQRQGLARRVHAQLQQAACGVEQRQRPVQSGGR